MTTLSVVVIGRNEGERLRACLQSVFAMEQTHLELEVIYVDSRSTDSSVMIAEQLGAKCVVLTEGPTTAARGRNAGWRVAKGEYVLFLDGDTLLQPRFVQDVLPMFEMKHLAIIWGHRREWNWKASVYNRALDLDWLHKPGWIGYCGGDSLFRRSALEQSGGYDENLIAGEEPELSRRLTAMDWQIFHVDLLMTQHDLAIKTVGAYWKRATRTGHAYSEVSERFAKTGEPFWTEELKRTQSRAVVWMATPVVALVLAVLLKSLWPIGIALLLAVLVIVRTAYKAQWRSDDKVTLLLYAVHSHLQHIPIWLGHLRFKRSQKRGAKVALLEYK